MSDRDARVPRTERVRERVCVTEAPYASLSVCAKEQRRERNERNEKKGKYKDETEILSSKRESAPTVGRQYS